MWRLAEAPHTHFCGERARQASCTGSQLRAQPCWAQAKVSRSVQQGQKQLLKQSTHPTACTAADHKHPEPTLPRQQVSNTAILLIFASLSEQSIEHNLHRR